MPANDTQTSKFMSYVLRHAPHELGLTLTDDGWTDYAEFSAKLCKKLGVTDADIRRVIGENAKKRFTLADGRIRAAQGHSVDVDLKLEPGMPPALLYHGTTAEAWAAIRETGLMPMAAPFEVGQDERGGGKDGPGGRGETGRDGKRRRRTGSGSSKSHGECP